MDLVERVRWLESEVERLKIVERAKCILMRLYAIDEPNAHRRLQKAACSCNKKISEVAKSVIELDELMTKF